jgi:2-polyprenyl-3-methyl-5-hydroxy-6-metoxy-1,4-benzoquinol methylase
MGRLCRSMKKYKHNFQQYLAAKKSVDDRAINRQVWRRLAHELPLQKPDQPLAILEIGSGIGTMIERMVEWNLLTHASYTALDALPENIHKSQERLQLWAKQHSYDCQAHEYDGITLTKKEHNIVVNQKVIDVFDFMSKREAECEYDLLVAHAFLDLIDVPATLPKLFQLIKGNGIFYFSINYDGMTLLEPTIEASFDDLILEHYHQTMDNRITGERLSGDSRTGRHLFKYIADAGGEILEAGASDWVVFPRSSGYPADEAYFLHFIIDTIQRALQEIPAIDRTKFSDWIAKRHDQIDHNELIYIAHQLDFVGRVRKQNNPEWLSLQHE